MGWHRIGECKRCGRCCSLAGLLHAPVLHKASTNQTEGVVCKHLKFDESGLAVCSIFEKPERPQACIDHPNSPGSLVDIECGYFFIFTDS